MSLLYVVVNNVNPLYQTNNSDVIIVTGFTEFEFKPVSVYIRNRIQLIEYRLSQGLTYPRHKIGHFRDVYILELDIVRCIQRLVSRLSIASLEGAPTAHFSPATVNLDL